MTTRDLAALRARGDAEPSAPSRSRSAALPSDLASGACFPGLRDQRLWQKDGAFYLSPPNTGITMPGELPPASVPEARPGRARDHPGGAGELSPLWVLLATSSAGGRITSSPIAMRSNRAANKLRLRPAAPMRWRSTQARLAPQTRLAVSNGYLATGAEPWRSTEGDPGAQGVGEGHSFSAAGDPGAESLPCPAAMVAPGTR